LVDLADDMHEITLENGLKAILKPMPSSPAISHWVWYRAGSRNEVPGITGISHFVEHMMFKGTERFPKDKLDRLLSKHGGNFNAFTSQDFTAYFETLPARELKLALEIESDRMQNAKFEPEEVEAERTVVISEREGLENDPAYMLQEEVMAASFKVHPYRWPVVGWMDDLHEMTRDDLYEYYTRAYSPENAFLILTGGFELDEGIASIEEAYTEIPSRGQPTRNIPDEPDQRGERRVSVRMPGKNEYLMICYHTPEITHDDVYGLMLLDAVMGGAKAVRSGVSFERSGRLHKALVEGDLASVVHCNYTQSIDPNLFMVFAVARDGVPIDEIEDAALEEIEMVKEKIPDEAEMRRALNQTKAQLAYATDGVTGQSYLVGSFELRVGWKFLQDIVENLAGVTGDQVADAASRYLDRDNRTIGTFVPKPQEASQ